MPPNAPPMRRWHGTGGRDMPFVTEGTMSPTVAGRNDDWGTPRALYESLDREFGFDVDVCANDANHKHPRYWTVKEDGLSKDWSGLKCFMNPPYGRPIAGWMRKAVESARGGGHWLSPSSRAVRTPAGGAIA